MPSVVFSPAARAELLEARDWYAARDVQLAGRLVAETETIVERIGTEPQQFPVVYQDIRRARCRRFPYALFFRVIAGTVRVIACFHSGRDPRQWQRRSGAVHPTDGRSLLAGFAVDLVVDDHGHLLTLLRAGPSRLLLVILRSTRCRP